MRRLGLLGCFAAVSMLVGAPAAIAQKQERRVALVVGNAAYVHTGVLANPKNDAIDFGAALKKLGFEVLEGYDLDKAAFDRKVRDFAARLRGADAGLFFFAGHGLQVNGQNYLVPIDAELTTAAALDFEMVGVTVVQRAMEHQTKTNLLFLDACRNNPLARNLARAMGTRNIESTVGLAPIVSGVGTLISFSTQPGAVAIDGKGRNSPFAAALVKHLAAPNDDLSAILIDVRRDVMKGTQNEQVPWEHSALTGRFYFTAPAPPPPKGPPADELTWALIKDTKDAGTVRNFVAQFPESNKRREAEQLAAALALAALPKPADPPPKAAAEPPPEPVKIAPIAKPAPPSTPQDELAWTLIKDTSDLALVKRFIEQYPESKRRSEAEKRAAGLAAPPAEPPTAKAPPPAKRSPAASGTGSGSGSGTGKGKCFSFDGRQFCQ